MPGMQDRCFRCKAIAEEWERHGGEKGDDYGKGNFYEVCKDHVSIGGKRKKSLTGLHKAIKMKNGNCRGNKRQKTAWIFSHESQMVIMKGMAAKIMTILNSCF